MSRAGGLSQGPFELTKPLDNEPSEHLDGGRSSENSRINVYSSGFWYPWRFEADSIRVSSDPRVCLVKVNFMVTVFVQKLWESDKCRRYPHQASRNAPKSQQVRRLLSPQQPLSLSLKLVVDGWGKEVSLKAGVVGRCPFCIRAV
jgi:hypothetical protein